MEGLVSPQGRVDVVSQRELHHLVVILVIKPTWVAREATRYHRIHETRPHAQMLIEGDMHTGIGRGREHIPT